MGVRRLSDIFFRIRGALLADVHPLFAHFPLALFIAAILCDVLGYIPHRQFFSRMGWWLLSFAMSMTILTILSGYLAESLFHWPQVIHNHIKQMERYGLVAFATGTTAWILRAVSLRHTKGSLPLHLFSTILLGVTVVFILLSTRAGESTALHPWLRSIARIWPPSVKVIVPIPLVLIFFLIIVVTLAIIIMRYRRPSQRSR